jgi:hypothetical protein
MAWWAFYFGLIRSLDLEINIAFSKRAGGEVANAQVCKTCIRGFDSRPALQVQQENAHVESHDTFS